MNMFTNVTPFSLLSEDDKELFRKVANILDSRPATETEIEEYKEKYEKPAFIDCEINWTDGSFVFNGSKYNLNELNSIDNGYIFADFMIGNDECLSPIYTYGDRPIEKATHARWYKLN